mmetsp:Transcript_16054/g.37936  ORF Transcript_16054/g.37936 Transcript_16054/m.37936 type:complete len:87 (-) Transcript_16054:80-340(-)
MHCTFWWAAWRQGLLDLTKFHTHEEGLIGRGGVKSLAVSPALLAPECSRFWILTSALRCFKKFQGQPERGREEFQSWKAMCHAFVL